MARSIVLGNGEMHVGLNHHGMVHDLYYPYVGYENHAAAKNLQHRVGVWVEGRLSWLYDDGWHFTHGYHSQALIGRTIATHDGLGLRIEFDDCVDSEQAAFIRSVHVINLRNDVRRVRLYFHQVFVISNSHYADTVQYLPADKAILHYKGKRAFVVNGLHASGAGFDQFSVGLYGIEGHEGTYRDAEDGTLSGNMVEHGSSVDSVIGFSLSLEAYGSARLAYWIAAGKSQREAMVINNRIIESGATHRVAATSQHWHDWLAPARPFIDRLAPGYREAFTRSLLIVRSHIDNRGGVVASTDSEMLNYSRDFYAYTWPRDSAFVLWPLLRMGYTSELLAFFGFCRRALHSGGYLSHKYNADGSPASSWHPYHLHGSETTPPIQADETAIVVFLFAHYYRLHPEEKLLRDYYPTLIAPMANFLSGFIDEATSLPRPSYDLWERLYLTSTYTTAVTYAALTEAARLAEAMGASDDALRWQTTADEMRQAAAATFFDETTGSFIKGFVDQPGGRQTDPTIDISNTYGAFMFGLFDPAGEAVARSMASARAALAVRSDVPAYARFVNDEYHRHDPVRQGNPWYISSLWLAQYALERGDSGQASRLIDWVISQMTTAGILAEQCDPDSLAFLSVSPLAWSQAELLSTLLDTIREMPREAPAA